MVPHTSQKGVQMFIGAINYYRDMWPRRSHTLAPLNKLTSINRKFEWKEFEQYAFDEIKRIVAHNNVFPHRYFNATFKIDTNASAFQLGAVISQKIKPIAFYSRKLTGTQQRYTVSEK